MGRYDTTLVVISTSDHFLRTFKRIDVLRLLKNGSYCTSDYIEIQRATCWLAAGQPKKAISLYEDKLRALPSVYQQNRAAGLARLAVAYAADGQPEQAANTAHAALSVARSSGSKRIVGEIKNVGTKLNPYRAVPAVAALLDELEAEAH
jgi:tetratricopeptide (TPR) repeat protein